MRIKTFYILKHFTYLYDYNKKFTSLEIWTDGSEKVKEDKGSNKNVMSEFL